MSRNTEKARRCLEAISAVDFDTAIALVHPEVVLVPPGGQAPYRGAQRLRRWMEPDAFVGQMIEILELADATERSVLGKQHVTARGRASGIELDVVSWTVWAFDEEGAITRIEIYFEHEEDQAREAAARPSG